MWILYLCACIVRVCVNFIIAVDQWCTRNCFLLQKFKITAFQLHRRIFDEIRQSYFGNNAIDQQALLPYVSLFSDINFAYGIDKAVKVHATKSSGKTFYSRYGKISFSFCQK